MGKSGLRVAIESILSNRIEQHQGEIEELQELRQDLERAEEVEESKVWEVLDKLWR